MLLLQTVLEGRRLPGDVIGSILYVQAGETIFGQAFSRVLARHETLLSREHPIVGRRLRDTFGVSSKEALQKGMRQRVTLKAKETQSHFMLAEQVIQ